MSAPAPVIPTAPATLNIESPDLTLEQHRAIREGKTVTAPARTSEPAAEPDAAENQEESNQPQGDGVEQTPQQKRLNQRFSQLTGEIKTLKDELEKRPAPAPERTPQAQPTQTAPAAPAEDVEPTAEKYPDFLAFQKDWNKWQLRQTLKEQAKDVEQTRRAQAAQAKRDAWTENVKNATAKHPDFREVAQHKDLPVTPAMADAITDCPLGTDILYHLGKNPDEAKRIAGLSPLAQIREIGKLEVKLTPPATDAADTDDEPPEQPVSRAPRPIRPIAVAAGVHSTANLMSDKSLQSMSADEYRGYRESGKIK